MAERGRRHIWHYRPGEMVVAVQLPKDKQAQQRAHGAVLQGIERHLAGRIGGVFARDQSRSDPIVFNAPGRPPLGFLFYDLAEPNEHEFAKQVIDATHGLDDLGVLGRSRVQPVGVMPHWLGSAQQDFGDGSPATLPAAVRTPGAGRWRYTYTAQGRGLNFRNQSRRDGVQEVPVLILDTRPDWARARRLADRVAKINGQLGELLHALGDTNLPGWHAQALDQRDTEGIKPARQPDGRARPHDVSDHALFIAGLIHDQAPGATISLRPVLNRYGVGDLHLLLTVLQSVISRKSHEDPVVINMSLGFLPKFEYMHWIWYGVAPPNEPGFLPDVRIGGEVRDQAWLIRNQAAVERTRELLHAGIHRLFSYLLANNCLCVAASGNDSLQRVDAGKPRLGPRIPARYETVLGVAALTAEESAAAYSNVGDEMELGDHIATFGGGITDGDEPSEGVIGVFTAPRYPGGRINNENGWAAWSGTSFATALISGLTSAYWGLQRDLVAEDVLARFHTLARDYAPELRTPALPVRGQWQRLK